MATTGQTTVNFGASSALTFDANTVVTGQSAIGSGSLVDAWIVCTATSDHTADEHWVDDIQVKAGNIVAGTGFTVYAKCPSGTYGSFNVEWIWN